MDSITADSDLVKRMKASTGMSDAAVQTYAASLRRLLYLNAIMQNEIEWTIGLAGGHPVSTMLRSVNRNLTAQINSIRLFLGNDVKSFFRDDLQKDSLHDIANVVHHLADLENISEIETIIKNIRNKAMDNSADMHTVTVFETVEDIRGFVLLFVNWWLSEAGTLVSPAASFMTWYNDVYLPEFANQ